MAKAITLKGNLKARSMRTLALLLVVSSPALAQNLASSDELRAAIIGHTVEGTMAASGRYAEFYAPDGSIHAADYAGHWMIRDHEMCFDYGDGPAGCWQARISGDEVVWIGPFGEEGSGRILPGNPAGW